MRRIVSGALLALSLSVSGAAQAELKRSWTDGEWTVDRDESNCMLGAQYEGSTALYIVYNERLADVLVSFVDSSVKSLAEGDTREIDIYLRRSQTNHIDDGWGKRKFRVSILDGGTMFTSRFTTQMLDDISTNDQLAFFYKDAKLASFALSGSVQAVKALRACAKFASLEKPSDPFANEN